MITADELCMKWLTVAAAAYTAGTNFTVLHGLPYTPAIEAIDIIPTSATASLTDDVGGFGVVSADATTITIKPNRTATSTFRIRIWLQRDDGGRNAFAS